MIQEKTKHCQRFSEPRRAWRGLGLGRPRAGGAQAVPAVARPCTPSVAVMSGYGGRAADL